MEVFASGLKNPRVLRIAPNGDIFLSEPDVGRVTVMRPSADGFKAAAIETFAEGLKQPYGLRFYPASDPKWLYVAELNRVVRFAYVKDDRKASGPPQVVVAATRAACGQRSLHARPCVLCRRQAHVRFGGLAVQRRRGDDRRRRRTRSNSGKLSTD